MPILRSRLGAEFLGTFWLVFAGCGTAILASGFAKGGVGLLGIALAFGLSVLTMAYAVAHISGAHFNPAVTVGLAVAGRFVWRYVPLYLVAQLLGGIAAAGTLFVIAHGRPGFDATTSGFAANGFGAHSPGGYGLLAAAVAEVVLTAFFVFVILGATDGRAPEGFAPIAIGLTLTLIHLISIPVDNTSVNPARSTAAALFAGSWALGQLWLFWLAPLAGAAISGATYALITDVRDKPLIDGDPEAAAA